MLKKTRKILIPMVEPGLMIGSEKKIHKKVVHLAYKGNLVYKNLVISNNNNKFKTIMDKI